MHLVSGVVSNTLINLLHSCPFAVRLLALHWSKYIMVWVGNFPLPPRGGLGDLLLATVCVNFLPGQGCYSRSNLFLSVLVLACSVEFAEQARNGTCLSDVSFVWWSHDCLCLQLPNSRYSSFCKYFSSVPLSFPLRGSPIWRLNPTPLTCHYLLPPYCLQFKCLISLLGIFHCHL